MGIISFPTDLKEQALKKILNLPGICIYTEEIFLTGIGPNVRLLQILRMRLVAICSSFMHCTVTSNSLLRLIIFMSVWVSLKSFLFPRTCSVVTSIVTVKIRNEQRIRWNPHAVNFCLLWEFYVTVHPNDDFTVNKLQFPNIFVTNLGNFLCLKPRALYISWRNC